MVSAGAFVEQERINSLSGWSKRLWGTKIFQKVVTFRTEIGSALLKDLAVKQLMVVNQFHHIVPAASDILQRGKKRVLVAQQDAVVLKIIQKMVHLSAFFQNMFWRISGQRFVRKGNRNNLSIVAVDFFRMLQRIVREISGVGGLAIRVTVVYVKRNWFVYLNFGAAA